MTDKAALEEVYGKLSGATSVTDICSTRIYPRGQVPDGVALPYITYAIISAIDANRLTPAGIAEYRVEVSAHATDTPSKSGAALAAELADAVWSAMTGANHQRLNVSSFYNEDVDRHQHSQDFSVWVRR